MIQKSKSRRRKQKSKKNMNLTKIKYRFPPHQELFNLLLSRSELNINAMRNTGCTALMISAMYGYTTICEMLLLRGANVHMKSRDGFTALAYACIGENSSINIVKLLIDARSNIYWRNRYGKNLVSVSFNRNVKNYLKMLGIEDGQ